MEQLLTFDEIDGFEVCRATKAETGLLYESGRLESLVRQLEKLLKEPSLVKKYGENAYRLMDTEWNEVTAAKNVIRLYEDLSAGRDSTIESGPGSPAEILKNNWYRDRE